MLTRHPSTQPLWHPQQPAGCAVLRLTVFGRSVEFVGHTSRLPPSYRTVWGQHNQIWLVTLVRVDLHVVVCMTGPAAICVGVIRARKPIAGAMTGVGHLQDDMRRFCRRGRFGFGHGKHGLKQKNSFAVVIAMKVASDAKKRRKPRGACLKLIATAANDPERSRRTPPP